MKRSRFTETQIVAILAEADAGQAVTEVSHKVMDYYLTIILSPDDINFGRLE